MSYLSTKTYGHNEGLSCAFRQWKANSHCNLIHGYALSFKLTFEAKELDDRNWVMDFGGLKDIKAFLKNHFDHVLAVAEDDPELETLAALENKSLAKIYILPAVGCEAFAKFVYDSTAIWLRMHPNNKGQRVRLVEVECREHEGNSAIYRGLQ